MLYNQKCLVYRDKSIKGNLNRPETTTIQKGPYPCCTSTPGRKKDNYEQNTPQAEINIEMVLFGPAGMDIQEGDVILLPVTVNPETKEVVLADAEKYIASKPNKPRGHHTECGISLQRSAGTCQAQD